MTLGTTFIGLRLLHFKILYHIYVKKIHLFESSEQAETIRKMKLFKALSSFVLYGATSAIVLLGGAALVVIIPFAGGVNIWKPYACFPYLPCKHVIFLIFASYIYNIGILSHSCGGMPCFILCDNSNSGRVWYTHRILIGRACWILYSFWIRCYHLVKYCAAAARWCVLIFYNFRVATFALGRVVYVMFGMFEITNNGLIPFIKTFFWHKAYQSNLEDQITFDTFMKSNDFVELFKVRQRMSINGIFTIGIFHARIGNG